MIRASLALKVDEQIERTSHLAGLVAPERLEWEPPIAGAWRVGDLLGHLSDCMAGFCAVFHAAYPRELAHFQQLRSLPVNAFATPAEACERIAVYRSHVQEGFALLDDRDLDKRIPTVFVPEGETLMTLLLGNLEHLTNHKYQLFVYLRLMGERLGSEDVYRFRGR